MDQGRTVYPAQVGSNPVYNQNPVDSTSKQHAGRCTCANSLRVCQHAAPFSELWSQKMIQTSMRFGEVLNLVNMHAKCHLQLYTLRIFEDGQRLVLGTNIRHFRRCKPSCQCQLDPHQTPSFWLN